MRDRLLTLWAILFALFAAAPIGSTQTPYYSKGQSDLRYASTQLVQSGLMADYQLMEGSGSTLKDSSGNGRNATFDGVHDPAWGAAPACGLVCGNSNVNTYVPLPSSLNGALTVQIFATPRPLSQWLTDDSSGLATNPCLLNPSVSTCPALSLFGSYVGNPGAWVPGVYNASYQTNAATLAGGPSIFTWTFGSGSNTDRVWVGETKESYYGSNAGTQGRMTSGVWNLGGGPSLSAAYTQGTIYRVVFYSRVLSDAEILRNVQAIRLQAIQRGAWTAYGLNSSPVNQLVAVGDSLTRERGYGNYTTGTYADTWNVTNLGVSGSTSTGYHRFYKYDVLPYLSNGAAMNVVSFFHLTNDGNTAARAYAYVAAIADAQRSYPPNTKIVLCTLLSRSNGGTDATKNALNPILRAAAARWGWYLADFGSVPELGADGASANTTNFSDGLHWNGTGVGLARPVFASTVDYACYADMRTPFAHTESSWTMLPKEAWTVANIAANSACALTKATGHTGEVRKISNPSAFTLTLTPDATYTEKINGGSTLTVAAGQVVTIRSVLRADSTGGCDWVTQ